MRFVLSIALAMGCASAPGKPIVHEKPVARDRDAEACAVLCKEEARCGADASTCKTSCAEDANRMKTGFVDGYVKCFLPTLASCPDDASRVAAHDRCFDVALAPFGRDLENQRAMASAVCERGLRCQGIGTLGRDLCMQATLDPKEPEVKLGQRLVDGLRRERVIAFEKCVDDAPCAKPDSPDPTVNDCYARSIAGGA